MSGEGRYTPSASEERFLGAGRSSRFTGTALEPADNAETEYLSSSPSPVQAKDPSRHRPTHLPPAGKGDLDHALLNECIEVVSEIASGDPMQFVLDVGGLQGRLALLWQRAGDASMFHRDILSLVEVSVGGLAGPMISEDLRVVLIEALSDLKNRLLTQSHVEGLRARFLEAGSNPLVILSDYDEGEDDGSS